MDRKRYEPCGTCFRGTSGSAALPDSQAAQCEGVPARELPERLRSADAQCLRDEQLRGGQRGVAENLPATGKNQSERCAEPGGRVGRNADGAPLGCRSGVASETGHHQPDRIVLVDGAAGGQERKALARRRSTAALDRHRTAGSREEVPTHQRLSRNPVAEGTPESVAHSAEGGPDSRSRLNLVAGKLTVPNIESRCNQLKLRHPPVVLNCHQVNWPVAPTDSREPFVRTFTYKEKWNFTRRAGYPPLVSEARRPDCRINYQASATCTNPR